MQHNVAHSKEHISTVQYAFLQLPTFFFGSFSRRQGLFGLSLPERKQEGDARPEPAGWVVLRCATFTMPKGQ
jgi:hypothetical protein